MKDKLSKAKDFLVIGVSLEINVFLTALLFGVKMGDYLWTIAKINLAALVFYGWLWFIEYYLSNFSASAMLDKKIKLEELKSKNKEEGNTIEQGSEDKRPVNKPIIKEDPAPHKEDSLFDKAEKQIAEQNKKLDYEEERNYSLEETKSIIELDDDEDLPF